MRMRRFGQAAAAAMFIAFPANASASVTGVLGGHTMAGRPIPCVAQSDGVRVCQGNESGPGGTDLRFTSFDGTPLEVWVTLPPAPASGVDGGYPLMVQNHGWVPGRADRTTLSTPVRRQSSGLRTVMSSCSSRPVVGGTRAAPRSRGW